MRVIRLSALMILLLPAVALSGAGKARPGVSRGRALLKGGEYAKAQHLFQAALEKNPGDEGAMLGLARAQAHLGQCRRALDRFREARREGAWSAAAAIDEAWCHQQYGHTAQAEAALEEAVVMSPESEQAWYRLGQVRSSLGDHQGVLDAVEALGSLTSRQGPEVLLSWDARDRGDEDEAWTSLWELQRQQRLRPTATGTSQALILEGVLLLDVGEPWEASEPLLEAVKRNVQDVLAATWRAESLRRQGFPKWAIAHIDRRVLKGKLDGRSAAIKARAQVDLGKLDKAEETLRPYRSSFDAEVLASRWYLARARGFQEEADWYADWYELAPHGGSLAVLEVLSASAEEDLTDEQERE
ncbi:MAG: tetratricopeptide repeat protein [Deltaproteobacteria bacterium]|nr:tetratricopeptide repeat protein [Deltaproteobacteria bacterium]